MVQVRLFSPFKAILCLFILTNVFIDFSTHVNGAEGKVSARGNNLSVHAKGAQLRDILKEISDQADLSIVLYGDVDRPVNIELENVPLDKGLKRILSGCNFSFLYQKDDCISSGDNLVLKSITILPKDKTSGHVRFGPLPDVASRAIDEDAATKPEPIYSRFSGSPEDKTVERSETPGGTYFEKEDRELFKGIGREEMSSQIETKPITIYPGMTVTTAEKVYGGKTEEEQGIQITSLDKKGFLSKLGLKAGDIIHNVNGTKIADSDQLADKIQEAISGPGSGMILRIEVERDDGIEPIYVNMK